MQLSVGSVDKVVDTVGTGTLNQLLEAVTYGGEVALIGLMAFDDQGRMNRSLDYRTDFYSLGVTFYELLTGQLSMGLMVRKYTQRS